MVLPEAAAGSDLVCRFHLDPGTLTVEVEVSAEDAKADYDSFAWQVLSTLATRADAVADDGRFVVSLTMQPDPAGAGGH